MTLRLSQGAERTLHPERLRWGSGDAAVQLFEPRQLVLHEHDRIRWTANDRIRGLFNAAQAVVARIDARGVEIRSDDGSTQILAPDDPMLRRLDLAYALNAHMAQGLTSDRGIAVMETRDTKLVTQQTFLVTVTRLRDELTLIVDRAGVLTRQLARNPGGKTSALETVDAVRDGRPDRNRTQNSPEHAIEIGGARVRPFDMGI